MPVPVWGCPDLGLLDETPDSATVVSDDIWKKFDLDFLPLDHRGVDYSEMYYEYSFDDGVVPDMQDGEMAWTESREKIRHHDCMWAGLCISKEHNRTLPAKKDSQIQRKVPAGRSVLISRATTTYLGAPLPANYQQTQQFCRAKYHLDSDGDSTRPDTPSSISDTETEDEGPYFRHDQINIHEKLSECMSAEATKVAPVNGSQRVTGRRGRRKVEKLENQTQCHVTNIRNTLSDHCYHLNQPSVQNLEHLGVQTPSDSGESPTDSEEEEIDVVTFEKPCRPVALPTNPSPADQKHFQLTVNTAFKEKPPGSRPRGRPPLNSSRKRPAPAEQKPAKRARHKSHTRRTKTERCAPAATCTSATATASTTTFTSASTSTSTSTSMSTSTSTTTPAMSAPPKMFTASRSSSDDELDTEKRREHNNMERQRRIELRNAFEELRVLVPAVEKKDKAPKVTILRQAASYCFMLKQASEVTSTKVTELKWRQDKLRARLSYLRRCLAMTR